MSVGGALLATVIATLSAPAAAGAAAIEGGGRCVGGGSSVGIFGVVDKLLGGGTEVLAIAGIGSFGGLESTLGGGCAVEIESTGTEGGGCCTSICGLKPTPTRVTTSAGGGWRVLGTAGCWSATTGTEFRFETGWPICTSTCREMIGGGSDVNDIWLVLTIAN